MAQITNKKNREQILEELTDEDKEIIKKLDEIKMILLYEPPKEKKFRNNEFNYMMEFINIFNYMDEQGNNYDEEYLKSIINKLHSKLFKNRRY